MMRSKLSSRNSARRVLLFSLLLLVFSGCESNIEPTYKEKDIPYLVKNICKNEYGLDVTTQRTNTTLWIYAPLSKILHKEYGVKEDKVFDEEIGEKLRNILTTVGRVLISADNTPEFFALLASDVNLGLDYSIIGNVLDIKKSYAGFLPWTESNRRYVIRFTLASDATNDQSGKHMKIYDVTLSDFLAEQIAQRIGAHFQGEELRKYFKVERSEGIFNQGTFIFRYAIKLTTEMKTPLDIQLEILKIIL